MRKVYDFHGGIHPAENKHQSVGKPVSSAGIPPELTLPLSQHIGAPAVPVVQVGAWTGTLTKPLGLAIICPFFTWSPT